MLSVLAHSFLFLFFSAKDELWGFFSLWSFYSGDLRGRAELLLEGNPENMTWKERIPQRKWLDECNLVQCFRHGLLSAASKVKISFFFIFFTCTCMQHHIMAAACCVFVISLCFQFKTAVAFLLWANALFTVGKACCNDWSGLSESLFRVGGSVYVVCSRVSG